MSFASAIESIREAGIPSALQQFGSVLDAEWVDQALEETGAASVRRRKLAAPLVVWLVITMALFRDTAIRTLVNHLGLVLPSGSKAKKESRTVASSSVAESRQRLGERPLESIFRRCAEAWASAAAERDRWRGLSLFGLDGSTLNVEDTRENEEAFGRPSNQKGVGGYPQVRIVALMALRSHLLRGAAFGPCEGKATGEQTLARSLFEMVPDDSLLIMDRNFINYGALYRLAHDEEGRERPRHWLVRARSNLRWTSLRVLGPGDELVELEINRHARRNDASLPPRVRARAIHYQQRGFQPQTLLTSLVDEALYPAEEIVSLYHERWEVELGYDELKTHLLERKEALRSRTPTGVRQELWGILLAYNLVRRKILDVADQLGLPPTRFSFKNSLFVIRGFCYAHSLLTSPGVLPQALDQLAEMLSVLVLPERRTDRRYERQVKLKMSVYKRNPGRRTSPTSPPEKGAP